MAKATFGSRIGLIAATVGSAVGLGNIWRFPAETQANGGGAFLIVYLLCVLLLGIPVMLGEFAIGREGGSDAISDYKHISPHTGWWGIGAVGIIASYLIICFYVVVAGWTLEYLVNSVTGSLFDNVASVEQSGEVFANRMNEYIKSDFKPLIYCTLVVLINLVVLLFGVQKGIERMSNVMMPLLFLLLLIFGAVALTLPGAGNGVEYFLNPDFSKITPRVVINALGQAFFSLSLGMAILVTYAAYFPKKTKLIGTATTVSLLDMLVSVMIGMIIFPTMASFGMLGSESISIKGQTLVFITLPQIFEQMPGTQIWSILFFLLLLLAALTSTISLAEVTVRFFQDRLKMNRTQAVCITVLPLILFGAVCSLSLGAWSEFTIFGLTIFDFLDTFATNILLPVGALLMCIYLGWFAPKRLLHKQLTNNGEHRTMLVSIIEMLIRWFAPVAIIAVLVSSFI